jgi:hypothetical protein
MFFRFLGSRRKAIDLDDIFSGPCFLLGGAPQLNDVKDRLSSSPVVKVAMNNTGTIVQPTIWIGADKAENFSASILQDPVPMKFAVISRRDNEVNGKQWKSLPNTYFMSTKQMKPKEFFVKNRDFAWDKNVFMMALQLVYRLGFREVYTVGCSFKITKDSQYCYDTELDQKQVEYTQNTYGAALRQIREILPLAEQEQFHICSCTPDSKLNDLVDYQDLGTALRRVEGMIPSHNTVNCKHPLPKS